MITTKRGDDFEGSENDMDASIIITTTVCVSLFVYNGLECDSRYDTIFLSARETSTE
jgi:hypothetical protein